MAEAKFNTIVCFGEVLWDMLPAGEKPGGAPMNVAIHLKRHGVNPFMISAVGNDAEGQKLSRFLARSGLDLSFIQSDEMLPTSKVLVHLDSERNATYEICQPVAWDNIQYTDELGELAAKTDLTVFGTLALRSEPTKKTLLKFLEQSPGKRFLDVNLRPPFDSREIVEEMLYLTDFAKLNDEELRKIAGWRGVTGDEQELAGWLSNFYKCPIVCVTRGANGAALFIDDVFFEHPGFEVTAVDTVGAGDSFLAGLIVGLSAGNSPEKALEYACGVGAFVASQHGAVPEYLPCDVEKAIAKNSGSRS
ncbi:fructokinase [Mariniphaga anaerophila]|uniref:Fructokinase n=1 Tax=Mariniphaga anaerophila TaxID=1484053 RepID=A0A1M4YBM9_9BACT|nr:carbohydrate kinase [Mariniphaga anaerophila]SHF03231.1 fructokinase [Mariniphaga anaerophila]